MRRMKMAALGVLVAVAMLAALGAVRYDWMIVQKLTVQNGGATINAGGLVVTDGGVTVTDDGLTLTDDDLTVTSGNIGVTAGNLTLTSGNATLTSGNLALTSGDATLTSGDLTVTSGHALLSSGNLTMTSGNATLTAGNLTLTNGNATLTAGNLTLSNGDLIVADDLRITAQTVISPTDGGVITPTGTYQPLSSAGTVTPTIATGAATAGDTLMLVNTTATTINIADSGTAKLSAAAALGQYDTLTLLFDGTNWLELDRSDN